MCISPCISICKTDPLTGYCYGCGRSNEDKKMWKSQDTSVEWKKQNISVTRGIVDSSYTKDQVLENLAQSDEDNWTTIEYRINEVASNTQDNTVYVWHWHKTLNTTFNLEFEQNIVTRFKFDEMNKVLARGDLSEERLVQSQLGFSLSR